MGGGGDQQSVTRNRVAPEFRPLAIQTGRNVAEFQERFPLDRFAGSFRPQFTTTQGGAVPIGGTSPAVTTSSPTTPSDTPLDSVDLSGRDARRATRLENRIDRLGDRINIATARGKGKKAAKLQGKQAKREIQLENLLEEAGIPAATTQEGEALQQFPLTGLQDVGGGEVVPVRDVLRPRGEDIAESPAITAALEAFNRNVAPGIERRLGMAGLGRSTALADALADAQANLLLPLIEEELAREERGIEREFQDFLRQQALAEQATFGPLGSFIPSTVGQRTITSGGGGK